MDRSLVDDDANARIAEEIDAATIVGCGVVAPNSDFGLCASHQPYQHRGRRVNVVRLAMDTASDCLARCKRPGPFG